MQIPMLSNTVRARVISMIIFVKALTIFYISFVPVCCGRVEAKRLTPSQIAATAKASAQTHSRR